VTLITYLLTAFVVPVISTFSAQQRPGPFSLFVLTLLVFAFPKAFVIPAAYADAAFFLTIAVVAASAGYQIYATGFAYEIVANTVIVLVFALASFLPQRRNQALRRELVRLFATMEMESHTQLLLLQRVIPRVFLTELIKDERIVSTAKRVAVLFCEVMAPDPLQGEGLHKLGNNLQAETLRTLSRVFKVIDGVMDRHGVFKVETIGSEYMAVSGLPVQCLHPRNPVFALVRASIDMLDAVHDDPLCRIKGITLQVGINAGTTVEAILGRRLLPRWKLFGDTVNTSSRMKSGGAPGVIHLSASSRDMLLGDVRGFCAVAEPELVSCANADLAKHGLIDESGLAEADFAGGGGRRLSASSVTSDATGVHGRAPEERCFADSPDAVSSPSASLSGLDGMWGAWPSDVQTHDLKGARPTDEQLVPAVDGVDRMGNTSVRPGWADVLLARLGGLALVPRTTIWCKGKGVMQTYVVDLAASSMLRASEKWHGRDTLPLRRRLRRYLLALSKVAASRSVAIESLSGGGSGGRRQRITGDKSANIGQMRMLKQVSQIAMADEKERNHRSKKSMRNRLRKHRSRPRFASVDAPELPPEQEGAPGARQPFSPAPPPRRSAAARVVPSALTDLGGSLRAGGPEGASTTELAADVPAATVTPRIDEEDQPARRMKRFSSDPGIHAQMRRAFPSGSVASSGGAGERPGDTTPSGHDADSGSGRIGAAKQVRAPRGSMFMASVLASRAGLGFEDSSGGLLRESDGDHPDDFPTSPGGHSLGRGLSGATMDTVSSAVGHVVAGVSRSHSFIFGSRGAPGSAHASTVQMKGLGRSRPSMPSMHLSSSGRARPGPAREPRGNGDGIDVDADAIVEESDGGSDAGGSNAAAPSDAVGVAQALHGEAGDAPQPGTGAPLAWGGSSGADFSPGAGVLPSLLRGRAVPVPIDTSVSAAGAGASTAVGFSHLSQDAGTGATSGGIAPASSKTFLRAMHSSFESGDVGSSSRPSRGRRSMRSRSTAATPTPSGAQRAARPGTSGYPGYPGKADTPSGPRQPAVRRKAHLDDRAASDALAANAMKSMREGKLEPQPLPRPKMRAWSLSFKGGSDVLEPLYQAHHAAYAVHQFPIGVGIVVVISAARSALLLASDPVAATLEMLCAALTLSTLPIATGHAPGLVASLFSVDGMLSFCRPRKTLELAEEFIQTNKTNEGVSALAAQLIHGTSATADVLSSGASTSRYSSSAPASGSRGAVASRARIPNDSKPGTRGRGCGVVEPDTLVDGVLHFAVLQALSALLTSMYTLVWAIMFLRLWADPPLSPNNEWAGAEADNDSTIFQFQGGQVLVLALAPALLGMRALTMQWLAPFVAAVGFIISAWRAVDGWQAGAAWLIFTVALSVLLVRDLEASRRVDFFTNYVAREGQRITEGMLHAMLPKGIADSMLNRAGTMRALERLTTEILDKSRPCGGCAGRALRRHKTHRSAASQGAHGRSATMPSRADSAAVVTVASVDHAAEATLGLAASGRGRGGAKSNIVAGVGVPEDIAKELGNGIQRAPVPAMSGMLVPGLGSGPAARVSVPMMSRVVSAGGGRASRGPQSMFEPSMTKVALLMFDLVGFTKLSQEIGPHKLVTMLDQLYDMFDKMVERRGAYKVETIGDAFLVCCGAPIARPHADSAIRVTKCALDMMQRVRTFKAPGGRTLRARVGIHIGEVLTGVIGTQMPRYQLFGPQVDYVMEMESSSLPGMVHASAELVDLIRDAPDINIDQVHEDGTAFVSRNRAARLYLPW